MMKSVIFILISELMANISTSTLDKELYLPVWPQPKEYLNDQSEPETIPLGEYSGCYCRSVASRWVVCFGRNSCENFPKKVEVKTNTLRVKTTQIVVIKRGDLTNLMHLSVLEIEANYFLTKIKSGVFFNMRNLRNMSISYNAKLRSLESGTFAGLINLKELLLVQNGFVSVAHIARALSPVFLPKLNKLSLRENVFRIIDRYDFVAMSSSSLKELNLILCQIEYIHAESLKPLANLSVLRIGENMVNASTITDLIKCSVDAGIPLHAINLYGLGLRKTPPAGLLEVISNSNITHLSLARNQFEALDVDSFPYMPNLEYLDIREVLALSIMFDAFRLPNLRTLLLSGNKLPSIPSGILLENLTYLDVSSNSGNLYVPSYFSLGHNKFRRMRHLQVLNLSFNRVNILSKDCFIGLSSLHVLGLRNSSIYHIEHGAFEPLNSLVVLNLENNPFNNPLVLGVFKGLGKLQVLLLGGCFLSELAANPSPFMYLTSLKHLGLERNHLLVLDSLMLESLKNLESIDISGNFLSPWRTQLFEYNKNVKIVVANDNKFTYLSESMLEDFCNLSRLDISSNPFTCECFSFQLLQKHKQKENILSLISSKPSFCVSPEKYSNLTIVNFFNFMHNSVAVCNNASFPIHINLAIPTVILIGIIIITAGVSYIYRWHIRYWMFLARMALSRRGKLNTKSKTRSCANFQYDAFVSYSSDDRNFIIRLVSMLENCEPFLKLCVYERDFQIGTVISETVLDSVAKSRKTLLIISDSYARSQWCRWEVQIAEHHRLFLEDENGESVDDSLVMVCLGALADAHVTPTLKYLMKTRIYLQWDPDPQKQNLFWDKLRKVLAPPKYLPHPSTILSAEGNSQPSCGDTCEL